MPASTAAAAAAWGGALLFAVSLGYFLYCYAVVYGLPVPPGASAGPALVDVGLFTVFALHHSLFARTRIKAWVRTAAPPIFERSIYTWIASALFIATCALWQPVPGELYKLQGGWRWLGFGVQAAGIALTFVGARALDVFDLAGVRPWLAGRGSPALITSGAFAIVRHPLYFGWALLVFGTPDMTATRFVFAAVSTAYLAVAIPWEERSLVETFGAAYEDYRRRVRWRMMPWVY